MGQSSSSSPTGGGGTGGGSEKPQPQLRPKSNKHLSFRRAFMSSKKKKRLLLIGLDSAGKTSILNRLARDSTPQTAPTEGFGAEVFWFDNMEVTAWDVGGQDRLRQLWRHYYTGVSGLIFVVDSTDVTRLALAKEELTNALNDEQLSNVTLLVFANKQDLPGAKSVEEVQQELGLGPNGSTLQILGSRGFQVIGSSAVKDVGVKDGVAWLCSSMT
jgi:small GTP-binding protein